MIEEAAGILGTSLQQESAQHRSSTPFHSPLAQPGSVVFEKHCQTVAVAAERTMVAVVAFVPEQRKLHHPRERFLG